MPDCYVPSNPLIRLCAPRMPTIRNELLAPVLHESSAQLRAQSGSDRRCRYCLFLHLSTNRTQRIHMILVLPLRHRYPHALHKAAPHGTQTSVGEATHCALRDGTTTTMFGPRVESRACHTHLHAKHGSCNRSLTVPRPCCFAPPVLYDHAEPQPLQPLLALPFDHCPSLLFLRCSPPRAKHGTHQHPTVLCAPRDQ